MPASELKNIPGHIGIIMDGNRRWARERRLPDSEGHFKALEKMNLCPLWFFGKGVAVISFLVFPAENWGRSPEEVNFLMKLLRQNIEEAAKDAVEKNYRLVFGGRVGELPGDLPQIIKETMDATKGGKAGTINVCLNYNGRTEIIDAVRKMVKSLSLKADPEHVSEEDRIHGGMIRKYLYDGELPDIDLIVRFSGEEKNSGFLLWQSLLSELIFMNKHWPEFELSDADLLLREYDKRRKKYGKG
ncbi:MAG: polyprenyl diphosphate synthase [Patescibacteria group bacterium]|jgi:undecaprenyl diphosphate synthase